MGQAAERGEQWPVVTGDLGDFAARVALGCRQGADHSTVLEFKERQVSSMDWMALLKDR